MSNVYLVLGSATFLALLAAIFITIRLRGNVRRIPSDLHHLRQHAYTLSTFALLLEELVRDAQRRHHSRADLDSTIRTLPNYAQALELPMPATSRQGKQARLIVLDMQALVAQYLRQLRLSPEAPCSRRDKKTLRRLHTVFNQKLSAIDALPPPTGLGLHRVSNNFAKTG